MATIQQKRASELAKINAAALKAGELAVLLSEDEKGKLFVGVDGQAGSAVAVRAGHADTADTAASADAATKLANAHNVSATGEVTAPAVAFDGTGDVALNVTINAGAITNDKLDADLKDAIAKADSAVQAADIIEGTENGTISVKGTAVAVHGLQDAAYATVKSLNDHADNAATTAAAAVQGTDTDADTAITVYGVRALAQKGVDAAAAAKTEADKKVASVAAADKSVVVGGTATAPTVKVGISATEGNALTLGADGLFVATPASMNAGNGISIEDNTVSAKVVAANGLSVDASGIKMAVASATVAGAVKGSTEIGVGADGALSVGDIDCGELL